MPAKADGERFQSGRAQVCRLPRDARGAVTLRFGLCQLAGFSSAAGQSSLCALDLGCGTGATAVRLARLGIHVTLLDSSPAMLDIAKREAREAGVTEKIVLKQGDATQLANLFPAAIVRS